MTTADDTVRAQLDAVAGVSRRAPARSYTVTDLSFGRASLQRHAIAGWWQTLTLTLTTAAAATTKAPKVTSVTFAMDQALERNASFGNKLGVMATGLRPLLIDHHLLSRPSLLFGADDGAAVDGAAQETLVELQAALKQALEQPMECPVCDGPSHGSRMDADTTAYLQRMFGGLPGHFPSGSPMYGPGRATIGHCAHAPMRQAALWALCRAHPELALEAAQVLGAAPSLNPPRFVLKLAVEKPMLGQWLVQRVRPAHESRYEGYGPRRYGQTTRRVSLRRPAGETTLSPALRGALAFASQSWEATGPLEGFAPPTEGAEEATPTMAARAEPIDVAVLWPEGVTKPAPPPRAPPPVKEAPVAPKPKRMKTAERPKPTTAKEITPPTPGQELMTAELRALGYDEARVKQLLKEGALERTGFGWFRWKG